jgi:hypothetical protein
MAVNSVISWFWEGCVGLGASDGPLTAEVENTEFTAITEDYSDFRNPNTEFTAITADYSVGVGRSLEYAVMAVN